MFANSSKKLIICVAATFLFCMTLLCLFLPKQDVSESERRKLKQFPEFSWESVSSGKFMKEFEEYAADQFPLRDDFRALKGNVAFYIFNQSDNNELYVKEGHAVKMEYPLQEKAIIRGAGLFENIYDTQLKDKNCNVYYSLIPDKNYFLGEDHLQMDYEKLKSLMAENLEHMTYIDIMGLLEIEDYYRTDAHWKQENLLDVAEALLEGMGADAGTDTSVDKSAGSDTDTSMGFDAASYETKEWDEPFYGVYYGQLAFSMEPDKIRYLTNDTLEGCIVFDYQNNKEIGIYDFDKAAGMDAYELFLSGSLSLIEIKNPNAATDKELVIFRDSFGSAIAPLLVEEYAGITLVDIRYLPSSQVPKYVDYEGKDVLFLYSTSVLNHSETMK